MGGINSLNKMLLGLLDASLLTGDGQRDTVLGGTGADWFLRTGLDQISDFRVGNPEERIN